ncbi:Na/Pi cotransporter family protein [Psychrobacillus sp. NPDC096426]|uniref:Na/Pi cotransporter family protein n=1 Tax=Psychrobacillus sp. NPDC096426 TaxID=3364491 RepID=UPI00381FE37E
MELNWQEMLFEFFGGIGIFLFAIKFMGDGLQKTAGNKLRDLLDRYVTNPLMGVAVGILFTLLIQSSSGTIVITIGLVSAGFMTLRQSIGVIMGANIGTTVKAFVIGFDIGEYALPIMAIGAFLIFLFKKKSIQNIGEIIFGFGGLFLGLELMTSGMSPLQHLSSFTDFTLKTSEHPLLGVIAGTVMTMLIQSSSASVAFLQGFYSEGLISLHGALPILFGDNIGTTITAVLASIGASVSAKRTAAAHVLFNVVGSIVFLIFLTPFTLYIEWIAGVLSLENKMQIAFAHGTFNVVNVILQFPLIGTWIYLLVKVIPGEDMNTKFKPKHLEEDFILESPSIAIGQAKEEILRMGEFSIQGLEKTYDYLKNGHQHDAVEAYRLEDVINHLDTKITNYLVKISSQPLSSQDSSRHFMLLGTVRDIERIGDHFENIIELIDYQGEQRLQLTTDALEDISEMFELTINTVKKALEALDLSNDQIAREVVEQEQIIDRMERQFRKNHIIRLNERLCSGHAGVMFVDILSNLERIGDHSVNIADAVLGKRI